MKVQKFQKIDPNIRWFNYRWFSNPNKTNKDQNYRTWAFWLSNYCGEQQACQVFNGGVGGYSTSHILKKVL